MHRLTVSRRAKAVRLQVGIVVALFAIACGGTTSTDLGNPLPDGGTSRDGATDDGSSAESGQQNTGEGGTGKDCKNATSLLVLGQDTGYVTCPDGAIERPRISACPQPTSGGSDCSYAPCASDAACKAMAMGSGICAQAHHLTGLCGCWPNLCFQDTDCAAGSICECSNSGYGQCVQSSCADDAECPAGQACANVKVQGGCTTSTQFACTTPQDTCLADSDCGTGNECVLQSGSRTCAPQCVQHP